MGSFLFSCGISNRVLREGTPVSLFFVAHQILDKDGHPSELDCFQTWHPENLIIEGIQDDYGYVNVEEDQKSKVLTIMINAAMCSAEKPSDNTSHPSWKQYFDLEMKNIEKMSHENIQEHFNKFLSIIHNRGIAYKSSVQRSVSVLKVSHVDQVALDTILETPLYGDNLYLEYKGEKYQSRYILRSFKDYVDYLILKNKKDFEDCINDGFSSLRMFSSSEKNYHSLLQDPYMSKKDRVDMESIVHFAINERMPAIILDYINMMGVSIKPSEYASQDYAEHKSSNYRNVMGNIFQKQKVKLLEKNIENAWENGENWDGKELDEDVELEDLMKDLDNQLQYPEVVLDDNRMVVKPEAIDWEFLQEMKSSKKKNQP